MTAYWISYRIHDDAGRKERLYGLTRTINAYQKRYWDRIDGFVMFDSPHSLDFLVEVMKPHINPRTDLFLIHALSTSEAALYGHNTDPDLMALTPYCRIVAE
jgi:hypothetical protein